MKNARILPALLAVGLLLFIFAQTCEREAAAPPEAAAPDAPAAPDPTPDVDPFAERLDALRAEAAAVSPKNDDGSREPDRESLVTAARLIADDALREPRPDVSAAVGRILVDADESDFAGAVLQRAVGLVKADAGHGKDHFYVLAEIRRSEGKPIEAASLAERVVHAEPTLPAEFVGLSEHYLAAERDGPARAAVERGLRKHPGDAMLRAQGAEVAMVTGDVEGALETVDELLQDDPTNLDARLIRIEAMLAAGEVEAAEEEAAALRSELPDDPWGYIFGVAASRLQGVPAREWMGRARTLAGDCPCTRTERAAIDWAGSIKPAAQAAPRSRSEISAQPKPLRGPGGPAPGGTTPAPR